MPTESVEMYLLTIWRLTEREPWAKTGQIAETLDVRLSSVSEMLGRLEKAGYIVYKKRGGASLTAKGRQITLNRLRKHRLLEKFLVDMAGYQISEVHEEACRLEHVISDRFADSLDKMLGYPQLDPHGHPIPAADGTVVAVGFTPLSEVQVGKTAVVSLVDDKNDEKLRYLCDLGLVPGTLVQIVEVSPLQGPITVHANDTTIPISYGLAQEIGVEIARGKTGQRDVNSNT